MSLVRVLKKRVTHLTRPPLSAAPTHEEYLLHVLIDETDHNIQALVEEIADTREAISESLGRIEVALGIRR